MKRISNSEPDGLENLLDVGMAEGLLGLEFTKLGLCKQYVGLDISHGYCTKFKVLANSRYSFVDNNVEALNSDAQRLPFKDDSFSLTLSIGVLEHLQDLVLSITDMLRVSKVAIVVVPLEAEWPPLLGPLRRILNRLEPHRAGSIQLLTNGQMYRVLSSIGVEIVEKTSYEIFPVGYVYGRLPFFRKRNLMIEKLDQILSSKIQRAHFIALVLRRTIK